MATFSSPVLCFRCFPMRPLRYLNGRTPSPVPAEARQEWLAVVFLLMTGLRKGEAQHAEFSDVDFAGKVIRVLEKPHLNWHPKTWHCREIPIPDELIAAIKELKNSVTSNFIFRNEQGGMSSRNAIYRIIIRVAERA